MSKHQVSTQSSGENESNHSQQGKRRVEPGPSYIFPTTQHEYTPDAQSEKEERRDQCRHLILINEGNDGSSLVGQVGNNPCYGSNKGSHSPQEQRQPGTWKE